jgi:hypothetical protein
MNIPLGNLNVRIGRRESFKPTGGKESLHELSNDNVVRVLNFTTSKKSYSQNTMLPHCYIHKFAWTPPEGKTPSQVDSILIDRRRQSSVFNVR